MAFPPCCRSPRRLPSGGSITWVGFAPEEHSTWLAVLLALREKPTRSDLVDLFPQWPGTQADTNCMGYISRGREWGLVGADLVEGRYELTELGHVVVKEGEH